MLLLITLLLIQDPAPRIILSDDPEPPVIQKAPRPLPDLPPHAISDPYGWERSQCSPYIRKDEPLEHCQTRVRSDLLAVMGEQLPSGLRPAPGLENCAPGTAANGYQMQCGPRSRRVPERPDLQDRVCHNQPRHANGTVVVESVCRPNGLEPRSSDGLRLTFGDRD